MKKLIGMLLVSGGLAALGSGCVVRGYASTPTYAEAEPSEEYTVQEYPPEPQYEEVTVSPGAGYVWIDGYWHWSGGRWTWLGGRWQADRVGYVYVSPYYDYVGGRYVYRNGYWSHRDRVPRGSYIRDHRTGRQTYYRESHYQRPVRDHRSYDRGPAVRDHRSYDNGPAVRDHRSYDRGQPPVRDHRSYDRGQPPVRDHRTPDRGRDYGSRDKPDRDRGRDYGDRDKPDRDRGRDYGDKKSSDNDRQPRDHRSGDRDDKDKKKRHY